MSVELGVCKWIGEIGSELHGSPNSYLLCGLVLLFHILSLIIMYGIFKHNQTYRCKAWVRRWVQTSVPKKKHGRVRSLTLGLLCHSTLKAKCECWSIFLVCIAAPIFVDIIHPSFSVIVSDKEYPKGTCLAPKKIYCGRKGGHSLKKVKTSLFCKFYFSILGQNCF